MILLLSLLLFNYKPSVQSVKEVYHDSHRTDVPFNFKYCLVFFFLLKLYFLVLQKFLIFLLLIPRNRKRNHEGFRNLYEFDDSILHRLRSNNQLLGLVLVLLEFKECFLLLNELVNLIEINPVFFLLCHHFYHQIKQLLHGYGNFRPKIRRHVQIVQPHLGNVVSVVNDFSQQVRMPTGHNLVKYHSQRKNITFSVSEVVR